MYACNLRKLVRREREREFTQYIIRILTKRKRKEGMEYAALKVNVRPVRLYKIATLSNYSANLRVIPYYAQRFTTWYLVPRVCDLYIIRVYIIYIIYNIVHVESSMSQGIR